MSKVAIVDYGLCNLDSVGRAVEECGGTAIVTEKEEDLAKATHIILPGVGAFGDAMRNIKARNLDEILGEQVLAKQIPFLGICLGMQLIASQSEEGGFFDGLGWVDGQVQRLTPPDGDYNTYRVPHIGWNEVYFERETPLSKGIPPASNFYFVHSFKVSPTRPGDVIARTPYCGTFVSGINHDWIFGVQFHPEKSQKAGFKLLKNFLELA
jgi:imidazole glycerol-phosphate synthase subunit HisH